MPGPARDPACEQHRRDERDGAQSREGPLGGRDAPPGEPEPTLEELAALLARGGRYLPPPAIPEPRDWVRLAIPLALQAKAIGVWLIGRRDPDDYYPLTDVRLLLGERLGLRTDEDADALQDRLEEASPDDPQLDLAAYYDFMTWLQESLAQALLDM